MGVIGGYDYVMYCDNIDMKLHGYRNPSMQNSVGETRKECEKNAKRAGWFISSEINVIDSHSGNYSGIALCPTCAKLLQKTIKKMAKDDKVTWTTKEIIELAEKLKGGLAERSKAVVLNAAGDKTSKGSNPLPSSKRRKK